MFSFILLLQTLFTFHEGDLLFQDCDCGDMCDAIEDVTQGKDARRYSHVAMVVKYQDSLQVIEANVNGVKVVSLHSFLNRYLDNKSLKPTISVGRLSFKNQSFISNVSKFTLSQLGKAYDTVFLLNNDLYYCSELIYDAFKFANKGKDFFKLSPMTYKRKGEKSYHPAFKDYYQSIHCDIPEGKLGLNPGSICRDKKLKITHLY